jgi:hypothetical protein
MTKQEAALRFQLLLLERGAELDTSDAYWEVTNGYDELDD